MSNGTLITERNCKMGLVALFIISMTFVLVHPHNFQNPTVPDERSYYGWALLYRQGKYAVALQDWYGVHDLKEFHLNSSGLYYLVVTTSVLDLGGDGKRNDVVVHVSFQDGKAVSNATVKLILARGKVTITKSTDAQGNASFLDVRGSIIPVDVSYRRSSTTPQDPPIDLHAAELLTLGDGEPYSTHLSISGAQGSASSYSVTLRTHDSFDKSVAQVDILFGMKTPLGLKPSLVGQTDDEGKYVLNVSLLGNYVAIAQKDALRGNIPVASIVEMGGEYFAVNHWAPGYSIVLGLYIGLGLENWINLSLAATASLSIYSLSKRLFGWRAATVSTSLAMTCAISLMMVFSKGMADYASMAFSVTGVWIFAEAILVGHKRLHEFALALVSGLALGASVWMRYSTITIVAVPISLLIVSMIRESMAKAARSWLPTRNAVKRFFFRAFALVLGLAIPGSLLASYNATYFGSPFSAGYSHGSSISIDESGNTTTAEISTGAFYENFNPIGSASAIPLRLMLLLLVMPFITIIPVAAFIGRKEAMVLFLLAYFLSNFLLYIFVPWVGSWTDLTRSLEDMRYFLPSLPAASTLASYPLVRFMGRSRRARVAGILLLIAFMLLGFSVAKVGIDLQLRRLQPPAMNPPPPWGGNL